MIRSCVAFNCFMLLVVSACLAGPMDSLTANKFSKQQEISSCFDISKMDVDKGFKSVNNSSSNIRIIDPNRIQPSGYVSDFSCVLTADERVSISEILRDFEQKTTIQFFVVTIPSLKRYCICDSRSFTLNLVNKWGVGQKDTDNGIVLFIITDDRNIEMHVGYGMENVYTNDLCKRILNNSLIPYLKNDDYYSGILHSVHDTISIADENSKRLVDDWALRAVPGD